MHDVRLHKTSRRDEIVRDRRRDRNETLVRLETSRDRDHIAGACSTKWQNCRRVVTALNLRQSIRQYYLSASVRLHR